MCARLWFGSLSVQNVLNQLLDAEITGTHRTLHTVEHGLQLAQQVIPAPPHTVMAVCHRTEQGTAFPRILQGRHVQVVNQNNVWVLQQPVASSVECWHDGGMDVAAVEALHALDLQLHVVLSSCFSILPLLPAVSVLPVFHLLSVVEDDAAVLRPGFQGAGEPLIMSVE